jgi:ABC-2 type transport system ATP-binding protein
MGLEDVAGKTVKKYSGGMIRRLEIACALLVKPRIIFLDEPTLGLDPSARKAVWENLMSFKREYGTTVFFNTHYMDEADQYSDEVAIINKGKIVKSGTAKELKHSLHSEIIAMSLASEKAGQLMSSLNDAASPAGRQIKILEKVRSLQMVENAFFHDSQLVLSVEDSEVALPAIMNALNDENVSVKRVQTKKPTLDDVFLKYAGMRQPGRDEQRQKAA